MLFRSNCVRPVYAIRGYDEGENVVVIVFAHNPNQIETVRSMLLLEYEDVVATDTSIETMKFDAWKVIG